MEDDIELLTSLPLALGARIIALLMQHPVLSILRKSGTFAPLPLATCGRWERRSYTSSGQHSGADTVDRGVREPVYERGRSGPVPHLQ